MHDESESELTTSEAKQDERLAQLRRELARAEKRYEELSNAADDGPALVTALSERRRAISGELRVLFQHIQQLRIDTTPAVSKGRLHAKRNQAAYEACLEATFQIFSRLVARDRLLGPSEEHEKIKELNRRQKATDDVIEERRLEEEIRALDGILNARHSALFARADGDPERAQTLEADALRRAKMCAAIRATMDQTGWYDSSYSMTDDSTRLIVSISHRADITEPARKSKLRVALRKVKRDFHVRFRVSFNRITLAEPQTSSKGAKWRIEMIE